MEENRFYDIHCHAMNLSHPNLSAFLRRINIRFVMTVFAPIVSIFMGKTINRTKNLLSVMENDLGSFFLLMEEDIKNHSAAWQENQDGKGLKAGNRLYNKVILTPLMMDFGYKDMNDPSIFYGKPIEKPIVEQVTDLFNGIKKYLMESPDKLLEIYPFLGINTQNYTLEKIKIMLGKYFSEYNGTYERLRHNYGSLTNFDGNIEKMGSNFFSGVKLYPPLGFDPWPEGNKTEMDKVEYLYGYCQKHRIPVTVHCSDGGFVVGKARDAEIRTSPKRWEKVLEKYPKLKINFAHMGKTGKFWKVLTREQWTRQILDLVLKYDDVYTDFSCCGFSEAYYASLKALLEKYANKQTEKLYSRILFGSDFMINLLYIDSYSGYIDIFLESPSFTNTQKHDFVFRNPERFMFVENR